MRRPRWPVSPRWRSSIISIGMPINFKELGIDPTDEQMAEMAASCARACGGAKGSAKVLHQSDMEAIYKMLK